MKDHNTDVTANSSDNCAAVKGALAVIFQDNGVVIRRVLCESRCWRRGVLRMGWYVLVRNANLLRIEGETSHYRCYESRTIGLGR